MLLLARLFVVTMASIAAPTALSATTPSEVAQGRIFRCHGHR